MQRSLSNKLVSRLMIRQLNQRLWRRKKPCKNMKMKSQRDLWLLWEQVRSSSRIWSCILEICCQETVVCLRWRPFKRLSSVGAHLCMPYQVPSLQTTKNICIRVYQHLLMKRRLLMTLKLIQSMNLGFTLNQKLVTLALQKTTNSHFWAKI